jgi:hypothetical protein
MTSTSILAQLNEIQSLSLAELRERWGVLYGTEAPAYSRRHLVQRLAYRLQELQLGGLSEVTRTKLRDHLPLKERGGPDGQVKPLTSRQRDDDKLAPGTRLIRIWRDRRLEVSVLSDGFEFEGRRYRSLSAIAREITSARWNGWLFFGLRDRRKERL